MGPAFLLLQYYDFHSSCSSNKNVHSSCSSNKNAWVCVNYAEGLHLVAAAGAVHPVWVGFDLQIDSSGKNIPSRVSLIGFVM